MNSIQKQISDLEQRPGVYKFLDSKKNVLYIGKALNLKLRVSSYFKNKHQDRPHIIKMLPKVCFIETISTENDVESMILEAVLIKKYQPRFNVELKDDKSFAWIYISTNEEFPRIEIIRSLKKDDYKKGKLFGPYPKGKPVKRVYNYIRKLFPFRTCNIYKKPCLYYHLDLCPGICLENVSSQEYKKNIDNIIKFLQGKKRNIVKELKKEMKYYANQRSFEKAAKLRDKIDDLEYLSQKISTSALDSEEKYLESRYEKIRGSLITLAKKLNIDKIKKIECYDVSNIQGKFAYGAMSVAINGRLVKEKYRIFKIKTVNKPDDPSMLKEVIFRRMKGDDLPDVILVDGGLSQISAVKKLVPSGVKLMAISKGRKRQNDDFCYYDSEKVKKINIAYPFLLIELRDEAHRFSIKYYRKSISKYMRKSVLDEIEGVGAKRRRMLLQKFGNIENIRKASFEELNSLLKNKKVAQRIKAHEFH